MTERQRRFCREFVECGNAAEAARRAGFSERSAKQIGEKLTKDDFCRQYIRRLQDEIAEAKIASVKQIRAELSNILFDVNARAADRIAAANVLLRAAGQYVHIQNKGDEWAVSTTTRDDFAVVVLPPINPDPDGELEWEVIT